MFSYRGRGIKKEDAGVLVGKLSAQGILSYLTGMGRVRLFV